MTTAVALWEVQGDLVMGAAEEEQYALTAADTIGPLLPAQMHEAWVGGGAVSGHLPWLHLGSFVAGGPFVGQIDVALPPDPGGRSSWGYGSGAEAMLCLFLVDVGAAGGLPVSGPWPFAAHVAGVVTPTNYPALAPFALLVFTPQSGGTPGRYRSMGDDPPFGLGYALGYANDAIQGWTAISPVAPWSTSDGPGGETVGGGVSVVSDFPQDAAWPLVAGRQYAVMAVPFGSSFIQSQRQAWATLWPRGPAVRGAAEVGTGYEDYPSFGVGPFDHWTIPDVRGWFPFAWPQYDPPHVPAGYGLVQGHTDTAITPPSSLVPTQHFRTGQRLHLEAYAVRVAAVGVGTPTPPPPAPGSSSGGFPWWLLALAGGAVGVAAYEHERKQRERQRSRQR